MVCSRPLRIDKRPLADLMDGRACDPKEPQAMASSSSKTTVTPLPATPTVNREQALEAVRTLITWIGDDPAREALVDTPERVLGAFATYYAGYHADPVRELSKTFEEVQGYQDLVTVKNISFISHCEHHMIPILGVVHVGYVPRGRVVGLSKLARAVDVIARRLTSQEAMTVAIAEAIDQALETGGVAVWVDAEHQCMTTRGVQRPGTTTVTRHVTGAFVTDSALEQRFLRMAGVSA